ncbi:hypothetical protein E1A91_A13G019800v1 [Gossypium mustelinum]|uniref:Glabrous enhancer-binding protein-like DBD domain-containing protein n=1 Tax=Gossypium mustelinum TaxID=34275 RepID=A0A5D2WEY8_GOSMU|nr:hypothetical protein E1A91_A13G019800v1 [Gossypium mustelinum]
MAPKRSNPIEVPPAASSSEEDEEVTSSGEVDEGSSTEEEDEDDPKTQSTPLSQKSPSPRKLETATPAIVKEESDESGSDSESDTAAQIAIATKPRCNKPLASSSKRPGESELDAKEAKRPKKKVGEEGMATAPVVEGVKKTGEDAKKLLFQRLFSEDDEIALLKGMLDYSAKKGADPCADMNEFYEFVKKSIHTDVSKVQLMDKIRRLKKKFKNNAGKNNKGEDPTFSKPHEQNAFELSKQIWGKEGISGKVASSTATSNGKAKGNNKAEIAVKADLLSSSDKKIDDAVPVVSKSSSSFLDKKFSLSDLEEAVVKVGLDIVDGEKKAALEAKWMKLQVAQLEAYARRTEFVAEQAKLLLKYYKSEEK